MIHAAGCYATTTQFLRELREGQVGKWGRLQVDQPTITG
jgi:hypothetical protein